jgi:ParB family chromosome partitioning protein
MARDKISTVARALAMRAQGVADLVGEIVQVREVRLDLIDGHPNQPRRLSDDAALAELARSIDAHGLLQPIILKPVGGRFQLVAGSRRLAAHVTLGRTDITAIILPDADADTVAIVENLHRRNLSPTEEAEALANLKTRRHLTLAQLQPLVGKSVSYLSEIIAISGLSAPILAAARAREVEGRPIPRGTLVEIARIKDPDEQARTWRRVMEANGSKRAAVRAVRRMPKPKADTASPSPVLLVREVDRLRTMLKRVEFRGTSGARLRSTLQALRDRIDSLLTED